MGLSSLILEAKTTPLLISATSFQDMSLTYPNFTSLELRLKGITQLTSLEGLSSLKNLKIQQTSVKSISINLLASLTNLESLTIYHNINLDAIPEDLLQNNLKLSQITIASNPVTRLPAKLFSNLRKLSYLDLGTGFYKDIPPKLLEDSCQSLKTFTMIYDSCNPHFTRSKKFYRYYPVRHRRTRMSNATQGCVRHMPKELLSNCQSLETFKYSTKSLNTRTVFPEDFFKGPKNLQSLTIHAELSDRVASKVLKDLQLLKRVDLSGNALKKIEHGERLKKLNCGQILGLQKKL